jgi:hypothetical protein
MQRGVKSLRNRKEEKERKQKTFVKSFGGWTSGPLDKCFLLKEGNDKCYVFFKCK